MLHCMTNISRETNYFQDFVQYPYFKFFIFPRPQVCSFKNLEHFLASRSYKKAVPKADPGGGTGD